MLYICVLGLFPSTPSPCFLLLKGMTAELFGCYCCPPRLHLLVFPACGLKKPMSKFPLANGLKEGEIRVIDKKATTGKKSLQNYTIVLAWLLWAVLLQTVKKNIKQWHKIMVIIAKSILESSVQFSSVQKIMSISCDEPQSSVFDPLLFCQYCICCH